MQMVHLSPEAVGPPAPPGLPERVEGRRAARLIINPL